MNIKISLRPKLLMFIFVQFFNPVTEGLRQINLILLFVTLADSEDFS